MKKLNELLSPIEITEIIGSDEKDILSLTSDSRRVEPGTLFVAVPGVSVDGHQFIPMAVEKGAVAVVCQTLPADLSTHVTYIVVPSSALALGYLASRWWDDPSSKIKLVGVTGTNGKTTTATLIYEMARLLGHKAGLLSTVCNYVDSEAYPTDHTTPDPLTLNEMLHRMVEAGCEYAAMEVSSHAADQHRIAGLQFDGAIFTNLTRDHLDYHKTFEAYLAAKKKFFDMLPRSAFALTNADDKVGEVMLQNTRARRYTYSLRSEADFRGRIIESRLDGTLLSLNGSEVELLFTGKFNAYNLTAVYGACVLLGWDKEEVLREMSRLVPVAGRFQAFHSPKGYTAIVDYAHTPDALENVIATVNDIRKPSQQLIAVCGCGGDRDRAKRPEMGAIASRDASIAIFTSDNPRTEDPEAILDEIMAGVREGARCLRIADRAQAIRTAVMLARPNDIILVAGKGHETYQIVGREKRHFDDREELAAAFREMKV